MEVIHGRCCVHAIEYHIVWCVKYRRKILTHDVEAELISILKDYASKNHFSILEANGDLDHIHLLIQAPPTVYIPDIVKGMKGISARLLFAKFPGIKSRLWGGHMWNPSYFAATVSDHTENQIKSYIRGQKEK